MKKGTRHLFICIFILSTIMSCEKTMFIDIDDSAKKIVLNGIISPSYGMWLNVSESVSSGRAEYISFIPLPAATVELYNDSELVSTITENNSGNYSELEYKPQSNHEYKIVVNSPGLPEASAVVKVPVPVEISAFDTATVIRNIDIYSPSNYEVEFYVDFSFVDPAWEENYYMLGVFFLEGGEYHPLNVDSEDLNINIYIKDGVEVLAWNDHNFNGQKKDFKVRFNLSRYAGFETELLFTLYSIEENYFKYLKTYSQNYTVLNDDPLLFEAVQVHSNIEDGYGIVAAVASRSVVFHYSF